MSKDADQKAAIIKSAFADVKKFSQNYDFAKALKAVNRVLGIACDDRTALHCKVVCLIQLSKFEEAYKFIENNRLQELCFEKAYCEYRLNKHEQALRTIDGCDLEELPPKLQELRAQILYRLERNEECFELYRQIIKQSNDPYEKERRANYNAVVANLACDEGRQLPDLSEDTYEQSFNHACVLINRKQYVDAERKLRACERTAREVLEEDGFSEEEMREELEVVRLQIAYCLQLQGRGKEAGVYYAECLRNKIKDPALNAVASNNSVVLNRDQNVFDSKKKIRTAMSNTEHKLTTRQQQAIALNNCLLALYTNANEQAHQLTQRLAQTYPQMAFHALLIRASQFVKDKQHQAAIDLLKQYADAKPQPANFLGAKLAIVQLQLLQANRAAAIETLQSLAEAKYKPGIISALVTLYLGTDNKAQASEVLKSAVAWYKQNKVNSADLSAMWRQAADFHLRGGEPETAAGSLEELLKVKPNDMKVLAQLVLAYAQFNPARALEISNRLPKLETLTTVAEIDAFESANWIMSAKAAKKSVATKIEPSPMTPAVEQLTKKKKNNNRKRKGKLPKNYNAEVQPDPERWLPKYERTGYRKKRDRRTKEVMKGSQGVSSVAADQYDMTNRANLSKNSPATPAYQETTPGPRQQHRKGGHKKKRGGRF